MGLDLYSSDFDIGRALTAQLTLAKDRLTKFLSEAVARELDEVESRLVIDCGCALDLALQGQDDSAEFEDLRAEIAGLRTEIAQGTDSKLLAFQPKVPIGEMPVQDLAQRVLGGRIANGQLAKAWTGTAGQLEPHSQERAAEVEAACCTAELGPNAAAESRQEEAAHLRLADTSEEPAVFMKAGEDGTALAKAAQDAAPGMQVADVQCLLPPNVVIAQGPAVNTTSSGSDLETSEDPAVAIALGKKGEEKDTQRKAVNTETTRLEESDSARKRAVEEEKKLWFKAVQESNRRKKIAEEAAKQRREAEERAKAGVSSQAAEPISAEQEAAQEIAKTRAEASEYRLAAGKLKAAAKQAADEKAVEAAQETKAQIEEPGKKEEEEAVVQQRDELKVARQKASVEDTRVKVASKATADEGKAIASAGQTKADKQATDKRAVVAQQPAAQRNTTLKTSQPEASKDDLAILAKELQANCEPSLEDQPYDDIDRQLWIVVGGEDAGGIIVRKGESYRSELIPVRLSRGATVMELEIKGNRLHYKRIRGDGPNWGWVNITHSGKTLLVLDDDPLPLHTKPLTI